MQSPNKIVWSHALFTMAFVSTRLFASIGPVPGGEDLDELFKQSDLVCSCSVQSVEFVRSEWVEGYPERILTKHYIAVVRVDQAYKVHEGGRAIVDVEYDDDALSVGEKALMFLKLTGTSTYVISDESAGVTPFSELPVRNSNTGLENLQLALEVLARGLNHDDQVKALRRLQGFAQLPAPILYRLTPLTKSSDPEIAFGAIAVLLKSGTSTAVETLREGLQSHSNDSPPLSILSIGAELGLVRDGKAVATLCELTSSSLLSIRLGAMDALRSIKTTKAVPALVSRLGDREGIIQYLAVITLAETFEKYDEYAPNMELFDGNPSFYTGLWKSWWINEKQNYSLPEGK